MLNYDAYSKMLTEQVEMCFPFENSLFRKLNFSELANIAEVGSGNGSFLKKLSDAYPGPNYTGYDKCEPLIKIAQLEQNNILKFQLGSAIDLGNHYDLVILRLIVHQLEDRTCFFKELSNKMKRSSQLVIIEPYDKMFHLFPELPAFNNHLEKHRKILSPGSANRNIHYFLDKEINQYGYKIKEQFYYYVPSTLPEYKSKYYEYMKSTSLITGYESNVFDEIEKWYSNPKSSAQIGLICYLLIKE